ncbi:hypothetical protein AB0P12_32780 [Streptomyces subrutilus]|uniref:hypothetical protein n=1 Tax=Streptomyces subrutilus TaxID=36818 RepID=UPI00344415FC
MTDDDKAGVISGIIDSYLSEVDEDQLDSDDLAWALLHGLSKAGITLKSDA